MVLKLRELSDQLESSGYALTEEDKILHLIFGLSKEYKSVVSIITHKMQIETITINGVSSILLNYEKWLE